MDFVLATSWWSALTAPVLAAVGTVLAALIVAGLRKWLGLAVDAADRRRIDWAVAKAVAYADQWLKRELGRGHEPVDADDERLARAVSMFTRLMAGRPKLVDERIEELVEARLGEIHVGALSIGPSQQILASSRRRPPPRPKGVD